MLPPPLLPLCDPESTMATSETQPTTLRPILPEVGPSRYQNDLFGVCLPHHTEPVFGTGSLLEGPNCEHRPLWIFGNQAHVALSLSSSPGPSRPVRFLLWPSLQPFEVGRAGEVRSQQESNLPKDTRLGSSRTERRTQLFLQLWVPASG